MFPLLICCSTPKCMQRFDSGFDFFFSYGIVKTVCTPPSSVTLSGSFLPPLMSHTICRLVSDFVIFRFRTIFVYSFKFVVTLKARLGDVSHRSSYLQTPPSLFHLSSRLYVVPWLPRVCILQVARVVSSLFLEHRLVLHLLRLLHCNCQVCFPLSSFKPFLFCCVISSSPWRMPHHLCHQSSLFSFIRTSFCISSTPSFVLPVFIIVVVTSGPSHRLPTDLHLKRTYLKA